MYTVFTRVSNGKACNRAWREVGRPNTNSGLRRSWGRLKAVLLTGAIVPIARRSAPIYAECAHKKFLLERHRVSISSAEYSSPELPQCQPKGLGLVVLEVLHRFLVSLGRAPGGECSKIPPLSGLGILLARVQAIFAGFKFSNHRIRNPSQLQPFLRRVRLALTAEL